MLLRYTYIGGVVHVVEFIRIEAPRTASLTTDTDDKKKRIKIHDLLHTYWAPWHDMDLLHTPTSVSDRMPEGLRTTPRGDGFREAGGDL